MISLLVVVLTGSLAALGYIYFGYLGALRLIVWLRGPRPIRRSAIAPPLTLVISAYNEAPVIRNKIENALELDYPADHLEILVISDASDDGTDAIVQRYASRGVRLFRQPERRGKTAGLNAALPGARGDIIVFSDANAMYRPDALRMLVRNFADPKVGCATGEARYVPGRNVIADVGERVYWDYEMQVKRLETALGSMVGGDGAIYAIRKSLWQPLPENAINDFLNPLQIVAAGWRAVYEPDAVCFEESAGRTGAEYRRRVRIVSRSWRAIFQAPAVLNPFRVGFFAWSVLSHKVLRWLSGVFAATAAVALIGLYLIALQQWPGIVGVALPAVIVLLVSIPVVRNTLAVLGYFAAINAASVVGVAKGSIGRVSGVWSTTREHAPSRSHTRISIGGVLCLFLVLAATAITLASTVTAVNSVANATFWTCAALLLYIYVGYPLSLAAWKLVAARPFVRKPIEPAVCVFIAANDEEDVIEAKLRNTLALDYPAELMEIVVASDGSVDRTNAIVRQFAPRVRLLEFAPRRGKVSAINDGIASVTSEIVVFSDANTFLEPDALRALVQGLADPTVGAVSGDVRLTGDRAALGQSEDLYYRYERWTQDAESHVGSMVSVDGALYAIRRQLFRRPAGDTILDDMAIPLGVIRAGYRVVFEPKARAYEQGAASAREEFARKIRVTAGAVQFLARRDSAVPLGAIQVTYSLVSHKALRWLSPLFGVSAFAASLVLAGSSTAYTTVALVLTAILACGVAGCVPLARRASFVALIHYFCLVQTAAAVGFVLGILGRQSVLWQRFAHVPVGEQVPQAGNGYGA